MSRASRAYTEKILRVRVGDHDVVSRAAHAARIDLCTAVHPTTQHPCTRAAGHDESDLGHPATPHVYAGLGFIAQAVWSS